MQNDMAAAVDSGVPTRKLMACLQSLLLAHLPTTSLQPDGTMLW